ncbi:PREDICTED: NEP1-interacting protein-like 1 [Ipomoea nil]|uniref:NEP1-interacting protein-like 1 n=1 Tax=Ipomoea nil TaxID=35883 RepID=UPI000901C530|nr:PREDICTED: NEP1-interacting protein-like 1 [Ipomoea nil]
MTGALIGQETKNGLIRGAAVGTVSGVVFSLEVFESSRLLWQSDESGIECLLYLIDVIASLLSGRLVRENMKLTLYCTQHCRTIADIMRYNEMTQIPSSQMAI